MADLGEPRNVPSAVAADAVTRELLFSREGYDSFTLIGVAILLGSVALTASYLPARRASRIDPMEALIHE